MTVACTDKNVMGIVGTVLQLLCKVMMQMPHGRLADATEQNVPMWLEGVEQELFLQSCHVIFSCQACLVLLSFDACLVQGHVA